MLHVARNRKAANEVVPRGLRVTRPDAAVSRQSARVQTADRAFRIAKREQHASCVFEKDPAGLRQLHSSRRADEEARAELVLEATNLATDRRLSHAELHGGAADLADFGDCDEVLNLGEAHRTTVQRAPPREASNCR